MASSISSRVLEIRKESIKNCMGDYNTTDHRQQYVDTVDGVMYYDDSKAENVNATWFTFENIVNPVVWIVGGSGHNNYSELMDTAARKVKAIVSLGNEQDNIELTFRKDVREIHGASSIAEAVGLAASIAEKNDIVLFSPACRDLESSYVERGQAFVQEVQQLKDNQ